MTGFHPVWYRMLGKNCFLVQILRFCRFYYKFLLIKWVLPAQFMRQQQKVLYYLHYKIPLTNPQPTANNTQNQNGPLPPYPPAALPSLSVSRAAAPTTHGAAAPYGIMQGARHRFRRHHCWLPCLGCKRKPNENIERKMGPWP